MINILLFYSFRNLGTIKDILLVFGWFLRLYARHLLAEIAKKSITAKLN